MAHPEQQEFCQRIAAQFPEYFKNVKVLDCGSYDVNGNNRYLFKDCGSVGSGKSNGCEYIGVDVAPGKNVDVVCRVGKLTYPDEFFPMIICTEMLEHDEYWQESIKNIVRMLKSNGLLLMTCATTGRSEHGTAHSRPQDSKTATIGDKIWQNYYKNLTEDDIGGIDVGGIKFVDNFTRCCFEVNDITHDLYFWGIKK
jgi:hypothetical protein